MSLGFTLSVQSLQCSHHLQLKHFARHGGLWLWIQCILKMAKNIYTYFELVCLHRLFFILILTFLSPWLIEFITGPDFHDSWPIVGILTWKGLLYGYFMICSAGIWKAEKTYLNLYISLSILVVGLILNFLIVPTYGIIGASVATVFTFFIWIVVTSIVSNLHWKIKFNYFFILSVFIISLSVSYSFLRIPLNKIKACK